MGLKTSWNAVIHTLSEKMMMMMRKMEMMVSYQGPSGRVAISRVCCVYVCYIWVREVTTLATISLTRTSRLVGACGRRSQAPWARPWWLVNTAEYQNTSVTDPLVS